MTDVQFANLSIRFGQKELLDYKELVTGAFLKDTYVRKYGRSSYHFLDTKIGLIDKDDPMSAAIWGRFVKETTLERQQFVSEGSLVQDPKTLESAPTSFFAFFLADHRLAFVPETKHAPTLGNLETTVRKFVQNEYDTWSKALYRSTKERVSTYTWKKLYADHVPPSVALVPLTARESIEAFVGRFSKIESLTVYVVKRNQDMNGADLFEALVKKSEEMDASSARFVVNGDKDDGLDIENTTDFVSETTEGGYERVSLRGMDQNGDVLKGTNEDFKLTTELDFSGLTDEQKLQNVFQSYEANKVAGVIKVSERNKDLIIPILRRLIEGQNESN
ncbi:hypothetical protein [Sulfitobacter sp.]|jgi:hypothetical protein|uniref:hypothetical protein n=1 Tax=Sulfitobacter sp. TaxID=1903071 RepID=UPI0039E2CAAF